jgi:hypothetical protein
MATMKKAQWGERVGRAKGQKCGLEKAFRKEERMYEKENRRADRQADREAKREARRGPRMRNGGTAKKGGSFPDLTGDGKVTRADVLKGRGVIKNGGKLKKAQTGRKVDTTNPYAKMAFEKKKKEDALKRLRSLPKTSSKRGKNVLMKTGGKTKKMMGGGKCRGGCY